MAKSLTWKRDMMTQFVRDRQGSAIVSMAFAMAMVISLGAIAMDASYLFVVHGQLQTTADAAALAAAGRLPDTNAARSAALKYAGKNMAPGRHGAVLLSTDIVTGAWDPVARTFTPGASPLNAVSVTTRRSQSNNNAVKTFFATVLGLDQVEMSATAVATFGTGGTWDIVTVQDVTGSFSWDVGASRLADQTLPDCPRDSASGRPTRAGLMSAATGRMRRAAQSCALSLT